MWFQIYSIYICKSGQEYPLESVSVILILNFTSKDKLVEVKVIIIVSSWGSWYQVEKKIENFSNITEFRKEDFSNSDWRYVGSKGIKSYKS